MQAPEERAVVLAAMKVARRQTRSPARPRNQDVHPLAEATR